MVEMACRVRPVAIRCLTRVLDVVQMQIMSVDGLRETPSTEWEKFAIGHVERCEQDKQEIGFWSFFVFFFFAVVVQLKWAKAPKSVKNAQI